MNRRIYVTSLKKVKDFLEDQDQPVYISDISLNKGLDTTTIRNALEYLDVEIRDSKIKLKSSELKL